MKKRSVQTKRESFENIRKTSKKLEFIERDEVKEYVGNFFTDILNINSCRRYICYTTKGENFAEKFNKTFIELLKIPVVTKESGDWIDEINAVTKQFKKKNNL